MAAIRESIRWVDYMYSLDGQMMWDKGPEGTWWKYTDDSKQTFEDRETYRSKITPNFGIPSPMIVPDEPVKDDGCHSLNKVFLNRSFDIYLGNPSILITKNKELRSIMSNRSI